MAHYADILRKQGKLVESEITFQEALAIEPTNAFALFGYANTVLLQNKVELAAVKFQEALAI